MEIFVPPFPACGRYHDPEKQCMLAPSGQQFCAQVVCKPDSAHCYCTFEGVKVSPTDTQKIVDYNHISSITSVHLLQAKVAALPKMTDAHKLDALFQYAFVIAFYCFISLFCGRFGLGWCVG